MGTKRHYICAPPGGTGLGSDGRYYQGGASIEQTTDTPYIRPVANVPNRIFLPFLGWSIAWFFGCMAASVLTNNVQIGVVGVLGWPVASPAIMMILGAARALRRRPRN